MRTQAKLVALLRGFVGHVGGDVGLWRS